MVDRIAASLKFALPTNKLWLDEAIVGHR